MSGPPFAAIVLAAGRSARMGPGRNKLIETVGDRAVVAWVVDAFEGAQIAPILVVTGHEAPRVREALAGRACRFVAHAGWSEGMGSSLACGARALLALDRPPARGVFVSVGDLPGLRAVHVGRLLRAFAEDAPTSGAAGAIEGATAGAADRVWIPTCAGRRGHPVLFGAGWLPALARLGGDEGARTLLRDREERVVEVELGDAGLLHDVDTPAALEAARRGGDGLT